MNSHEITQIITVLSGVWPEKMKTPEQAEWTTEAYKWALTNEDADDIRAATETWIRTQQWFPKPAELIALAEDIADGKPIKALPPTEYVWTEGDYQRMLRIEILAMDMGITLHPNAIARLERERAKRKATT